MAQLLSIWMFCTVLHCPILHRIFACNCFCWFFVAQAAKHKYEVLCREGANINRRVKEQADATRLAEASAALCCPMRLWLCCVYIFMDVS